MTSYDPLPVPDAARELPSFTEVGGAALWLEPSGALPFRVAAPREHPLASRIEGKTETTDAGLVHYAEPNAVNAAVLREALEWLTPKPLGLATSAGFGDRLGVATPGHVRAMQHSGGGITPIYAQQSIREMTRTNRTPQEVMDDATWGAFAGGWRGPLGADADHQKTTADLGRCAAAGFTFFTVDPGEHVDDSAHDADESVIADMVAALPWDELETTQKDFEAYAGQSLELSDRTLTLQREDVLRAAAKYGRAVLHVTKMYRHLADRGVPFELEVSVDETETPTSHAEHAVVALELARLGVRWISLAPRFVGRFEKGVDYLGDLDALRRDLSGHAALAKALGPYKLSLHSGSDKFSVYPLIAEATGGVVHLKTAGTSYLEALRVASVHQPELFREIYALGRERFETEKQSYHVSASLSRVPAESELTDAELPALLNQDDARQVLHVTFGSALDRYREALQGLLQTEQEAYYDVLNAHFKKHLTPFAAHSRSLQESA